MQHLSGYNFKLKFDPELLFNQRFQYQNRISSEFNTLYHWHPLMPEAFHIEEQVYSYKQFVFNTSVVTEHGINNLVDSFTKQVAGRVSNINLAFYCGCKHSNNTGVLGCFGPGVWVSWG